jgi:hypothetical protein
MSHTYKSILKIAKSALLPKSRFQLTMPSFTASECDVLMPLLQEAVSKLEMIMNIPMPSQEKANNSSIHRTRRDHPVGPFKLPSAATKFKIPDPKTVKTMMQATRLLLAILDTCEELRSLGTVEKFQLYVQELVEEQKQNIRRLDKTSVRIRKKVASDTYLNDPDFIAMRESEAELTNRLYEMKKVKCNTSCGSARENADIKLAFQVEESSMRREIGSVTVPIWLSYT